MRKVIYIECMYNTYIGYTRIYRISTMYIYGHIYGYVRMHVYTYIYRHRDI